MSSEKKNPISVLRIAYHSHNPPETRNQNNGGRASSAHWDWATGCKHYERLYSDCTDSWETAGS